MSVINQMLQDLEARGQADAQAKPDIQAGTRAAAVPARPLWKRIWRWSMVILLVLGLLDLLWAGWQIMQERRNAASAAPPQAAAPVLAAAAPDTSNTPETSEKTLRSWGPAPLQMSLQMAPWRQPETKAAVPGADAAQAPAAAVPTPGNYPPATPAATSADASPSRRELNGGRDASDVNKPRAESRAEAAKPADPTPRQQAEAESRRGVELARGGRMLDAIDAFDRSLMLDRSYVAARLNLANALVEVKRVDEAMARLQEGLDENRANGALAMRLAGLQLDRNDTRAAIDTLGRSLPYDRERADYQAFMAGLLQREGRNAEAIDYYLTALRRAPKNAGWWMGLGASLQAEKRLPEAREALQRAQSLGGLSPEQQANLQQRLEQMR